MSDNPFIVSAEKPQLDYHVTKDSTTLVNVFSRLSAYGSGNTPAVGNPATGIGTARDPSTHARLNYKAKLTTDECIQMYLNSGIARNIIEIYPNEASWFIPQLGTQRFALQAVETQKITSYLEKLKTGSLETKMRTASIEARLHGQSWLLLGINDGRRFNLPVNETNIRSFDWVECFDMESVCPVENDRERYEILLGKQRLPKSVVTEGTNSNYLGHRTLIVHESRLLCLIGDYNPPSVQKKLGMHSSVLQAVYSALLNTLQGVGIANAMLQDHSLFWYKLDGLATLVRQGKLDELYSRFLALQMSKSAIQGMALDAKNEDVGFIHRNYTGVKDILELLIDHMVAESRMVRFKVLGTANRAGLGAEGRGIQDRCEHALKIKAWQRVTWRDHILYILRLALLAKDSPTKGRMPKTLGIQFPIVLDLTPAEIAELYATNVSWAKEAVTNNLLDPLEARIGLFGSNELILNPMMTLDERLNQYLEDQLDKKIDNAKENNGKNETENAIEYDLENANENKKTEENETEEETLTTQDELELVIDSLGEEVLQELTLDADWHYLVWFSDKNGQNKHRTPIAVRVSASNATEGKSKAITAARAKCTRHCELAANVRQATEAEKKIARSGNWIRTGPQGQKAGYKGVRGVGPALKRDEIDHTDLEDIDTRLDLDLFDHE